MSAISVKLTLLSDKGLTLAKVLKKSEYTPLKDDTYRKANHTCECCGAKASRFNEVWGYDEATSIQTLEKVEAICTDCFFVRHIGLANVLGEAAAAFAHLMRVNGWDEETAKDHVNSAMGRNSHLESLKLTWRPDLLWLLNAYPISPESIAKLTCDRH